MSREARRRPVVLYQPRDEGACMPLGLLSLGSRLAAADAHVVIVDGRFELAPEARVVQLAERASCLGVTVRTGTPLHDALRISAAARAANPRLHVLWGGPHATWAPESCLATGMVDGCVRGAGEEPLAAAVAAIHCGRSLEPVPGLVLPGGVVPRPVPAPAPAEVPPAVYSLLDVERHFEARGARQLDYCSSRGVRDAGWSGLTAERVLAELGELAERHRLSEVVFQDEDFFADPARAAAIAEGLLAASPALGWQAGACVLDVLEGGHDHLALLARTGCRRLHLRVPPGVPAAGGLRDQVLDAAALLRAAGLPARFDLCLDERGPRLDGLKAVVSLARRLCALDPRFETPLRRPTGRLPAAHSTDAAGTLEGWAAREQEPWPDLRAERLLTRASFFFREAQRTPGRRLGQHLLHLLSLVRVRVGFFALDLERRAVEASALLRTGRPRPQPRLD
ncbi:MAG TPA: cobalamin B12-binding domain-containing protein [Vicinamibacteria bacterium]|nr:cobalamin B12-binding domain-containing protein [Vicinamibacteria bacterium]